MKSTQRISSIAAGKLVLGALAAVFAFTAAAHAQPAFSGKFVLPQQVRWNGTVLPAGEYSIEMSSLHRPAVLYSTRTHRAFYTGSPAVAESVAGGTELYITIRQGERIVNSLNLPRMGKSLVFSPLTKAEQEAASEASHTETTPVITAQK